MTHTGEKPYKGLHLTRVILNQVTWKTLGVGFPDLSKYQGTKVYWDQNSNLK